MIFRGKKVFVKAIPVVFLVLLFAGCKPIASQPATACAPGTYDEEILSGGQVRQYRLHVPPAYQPGKPVPLLFGFHGAGSSAGQFEEYSGFSALADRAGFIAVYPQGLGELTNWDTMPGSQDVQLVRDLLDSLEARCSIDPARIYATGHSRGGGMANRLGCELSDRLAAIAPVSGDYEYGEDCSPYRPVAVVAFHGTNDPTIPYNGFGVPGQPHESYVRIGTPLPTWAATWAERNGCSNKPAIIFQEGQVTGQQWGNCQAGADVILYTVYGGTHEWPDEVNAAQMIWDFFTQHPSVSATSP
jgi:polyhydroxybutyrate depolymerase